MELRDEHSGRVASGLKSPVLGSAQEALDTLQPSAVGEERSAGLIRVLPNFLKPTVLLKPQVT